MDVVVRGPAGAERTITATIDTGFTDARTLPESLVRGLSLAYVADQSAVLANGQTVVVPGYEATVIWDARPRLVPALATGGTALVGMELLNGHELSMQVKGGGPFGSPRSGRFKTGGGS